MAKQNETQQLFCCSRSIVYSGFFCLYRPVTMIRSWSCSAVITTSRRLLSAQSNRVILRRFSTSPLQSDVGPLATRVHHNLTLGLAVLTPIYFAVPDAYTDGTLNHAFGLLLTASMTAHSHIGLNYVATDYVPKISKALLGPARVVILALSTVTLIGMGKIAVGSPGGIKGTVKGLWNPLPKEKDPLKDF